VKGVKSYEKSIGLWRWWVHRWAPFGRLRASLVKKLKKEGYWVRGIDIKEYEFAPTQADEFLLLDLRKLRSGAYSGGWHV